ncbi:hypothetical protein QBC33DRAFT_603160 [Phialemonium atrogriseum]|uniref:Uncharacterized protein n=1 Tax=Phialemonium atrogriseum TaxID=1093897 RepID=A0AAJ0FIZ2_9PEZI|nr:uncharacterized protein QBC33DRAFT_603160 [Phialemonium atrogriseum]KAK1770096.1 hypothetical protein QBC33DRAFT_603160 [Phialemonium atrogriseum]
MAKPTPAYYPEGWDRERMLNAALSGEINNLTDDQRGVFREGLRADIGQQGFDQFFDEMFRREADAPGNEAARVVKEPPFIETMSRDRWGFMVFKSPEIVDAARWAACKERFLQIVLDTLNPYCGHERLDECISNMSFQWVEDIRKGDGDIPSIARAYASSTPPSGLNHSLCLYVTPSSLDSILDSPQPSTAKRQYRTNIPFVIAISTQAVRQHLTEGDDTEGFHWRGFFNIAVESLVESLFPIVAEDSMTPYEIGGRVSGEDIWCDFTRWGTHKAGLGYWDMRTGQAGDGL